MFQTLLNNFLSNSYLSFSDGAKFALIARNLFQENGYTTDFSFWGSNFFATGGIPFLIPHLINLFFRMFGATDFAVLAFSFTFYLLLVVSVYLLTNKLYGKLVGILSALAVASNYNFIDYATSGASETLFAFEIVISLYLFTFKKWWVNLIGLLVLGSMYFSRPQAFIFIAGIFLYWLVTKFGIKKALISFFGLGIIGFIFDKYVIYPLSFKYPLTPIFARGIQSILTYSSFSAVSDSLRGGASSMLTVGDILKKIFYNLYNFYKALPEIMNPYLFGLFVIGLFKKQSAFNISVLFMTGLTFLVTALTIPFYRYLHPIVPLIYILGVATLVEIFKDSKYKIYIVLFLIIFFAVGQTLGIIFLDSRFAAKTHNVDKAPIYAEMSYKLKEITNKEDVVVTNLDTWGSWYGERKTIWFPLEPSMILSKEEQIDAIYLTSYKMDDDNYYMGEEWREIFNNPKNQKILPNYKFVGEYEFKKEDNYERNVGRAILLMKK